MNDDGSAARPAHIPTSGGRPPQAVEALRHCLDADCRTTLSRYNPDDWCTAHGGWSDATIKRPGRRAAGPEGGRRDDITADRRTSSASGTAPGAQLTIDVKVIILSAGPVDPGSDGGAVPPAAVTQMDLSSLGEGVRAQRLRRGIASILTDSGVEVELQPHRAILRGALPTTMDCIEDVHRLIARHDQRVAAKVTVVHLPGAPPRALSA